MRWQSRKDYTSSGFDSGALKGQCSFPVPKTGEALDKTPLPHRRAGIPLHLPPQGSSREITDGEVRGATMSPTHRLSLGRRASSVTQNVPLLNQLWNTSSSKHVLLVTPGNPPHPRAQDNWYSHLIAEKPEAQRWSDELRVARQQEAAQDEIPGWRRAQVLPAAQNCFWRGRSRRRIPCLELHRKEAKPVPNWQ